MLQEEQNSPLACSRAKDSAFSSPLHSNHDCCCAPDSPCTTSATQAPSSSPCSSGRSPRTQNHGQPRRRPSRGPVNTAVLIDFLDSVLAGHDVDLSTAYLLRHAASKGDITIKPPEFETRVRQSCEPDVGANLLQLLGERERLMAAARSHNTPEFLSRRDSSSSDRSLDEAGVGSMCSSDNGSGAGAATTSQAVIDACLASASSEWRWNAFALAEATGGCPLATLGLHLIKQAGLIEALNLSETKLIRYLHAIEDGYPPNPYHNSTHASDVLQSMHMILVHGGLLRQVGGCPLVHLGAYLAAIIHDYEHRGVNNHFLVASCDELAMTYNDVSPMENHHVSAALRLMQQPRLNFCAALAPAQRTSLRQTLVSMVLATDMTQHFQVLSKLQAQLLPDGSAPAPLSDDPEDNDQRLVWLQVALKAADVGHLSAHWDVHQRWVAALEEEFFRQGDREAAMRMAVSALMDRTKPGISKSQVSFFSIVARPLFKALATALPVAAPLLGGVEANCTAWADLAAGPRPPQTPTLSAPMPPVVVPVSPDTRGSGRCDQRSSGAADQRDAVPRPVHNPRRNPGRMVTVVAS